MKDHEFICRKHEEKVTVIRQAPLGQSPETPPCPECGEAMGKVFGTPLISYETKWHHAQKNVDWG